MKQYRTEPTHKTARMYYRKNGNTYLQFELRDNDDNIYDISPRGFKYSKLPLEINDHNRESVNTHLRKEYLSKKNFGVAVDMNHAKRNGKLEKYLIDNNVFQI